MLELKAGNQLARRYVLGRQLGRGGEAQIWLATDKMTAASVALKIVPASKSIRLRAEWQTGIRLIHAHIVRVFEFHEEDSLAFFSMQLIDGASMASLTGRSLADVLAPIGLIARALQHLHDKGLVHRDIKASNLLLDDNGVPYLSDFGVCCAIGTTGRGGSLISQSPASLQQAPASPADDIFALGATLYELIGGRSPWSSDATEADIRRAAPAPLQTPDGAELPRAVADLVRRMLAQEPTDRPTAAEVARDLAEAGFTPAAASLSTVRSRRQNEESVSPVQQIRPERRGRVTTTVIPDSASGGLNRNVVFGALGVLIVVLVLVVFVLPEQLGERRKAPAVVVEAEPLTPDEVPPAQTKNAPAIVTVEVPVDPEIRARVRDAAILPSGLLEGDDEITFNENLADYSGLDERGRERFYAESTAGELLSAFEVLEGRGVDRWAPVEHRRARELNALGDAEYLEQQFENAEEYYLGGLTVLEPLYARIQAVFDQAFADAEAAFAAGDRLEALRLYELAVAVTPTHPGALAGLRRAQNLEDVQRLVAQGLDYEEELDYVAAQSAFERAIELDELWQPAQDGLVRIKQARTKLAFDTRMSEGFEMIATGDYLGARAAFRTAQRLIPASTEPTDGLLQVDQGLRLRDITTLEQEALALERDEHWDAVVATYEEILNVDATLQFAMDGLARGREMGAIHRQLDDYIEEPDKLSQPAVMQRATGFVVELTARKDAGPRMTAQRAELLRLLKRAATPLAVPLLSDNATEVTVYRVGHLGRFAQHEINLRPGTYVAVGSRTGYRDVRLEFRVAPEIDIEPVIIQCQEPI